MTSNLIASDSPFWFNSSSLRRTLDLGDLGVAGKAVEDGQGQDQVDRIIAFPVIVRKLKVVGPVVISAADGHSRQAGRPGHFEHLSGDRCLIVELIDLRPLLRRARRRLIDISFKRERESSLL